MLVTKSISDAFIGFVGLCHMHTYASGCGFVQFRPQMSTFGQQAHPGGTVSRPAIGGNSRTPGPQGLKGYGTCPVEVRAKCLRENFTYESGSRGSANAVLYPSQRTGGPPILREGAKGPDPPTKRPFPRP